MIKELKEAKQERNRLYSIMTAYERQTVAEYIGETVEKYRMTIVAGALAVHKAARDGVMAAQARVEAERRKITNSWDASKLAPELQVYSIRVDHAAKNADLAALQSLYQEAKDSGDKYKQQAAAEALATLTSKIPAGSQDTHGTDMRLAANRLANQAGRDLDALKITPDLVASVEEMNKKIDELKAAESLLRDTADVLGELNPNGTLRNSAFIKPLESVTQDESGKFSIKE